MPTTEEGLAATRRPDPLLQEIDTRPKGQASNCACLRRHLLESRMREIRTSGSTRGGAILNPPPTLPAKIRAATVRERFRRRYGTITMGARQKANFCACGSSTLTWQV